MSGVSFSPDGKRIVSSSNHGTVLVWDTATGKRVGRFGHIRPVNDVSFSPDGKRIVSGG